MIVVGFRASTTAGELRRCVLRDLVGGRILKVEGDDDAEVQTWFWYENGRRVERRVTRDVRGSTLENPGLLLSSSFSSSSFFPPDGGVGMRARATWAWYPAPGVENELLFPRGAEIREIEDVNDEFLHGVYMGAKGMFPALYVRMIEGSDRV
ncbi:hypothetical protein VTK73DRAFT_10052 [Phialemonium thermophilum]|uniref:SH3 domain-containing protein n=1 Tax=Phialemonium thermophilum TaxID=223376 RepID=A0ABR3VZ54_9PEZI